MCLLLLFLGGRISLFIRRMGEVVGFDPGAQIEMVQKLTWAVPTTPIRESFYGYHPPLGFLMARTIHLLGPSPEVSVQIVSFTASLLAFFMMRSILKWLRLLYRPSGMAFLYFSASMPIQISLSTSVNLDILLLALSTVTLAGSVRLLWPSIAFRDTHLSAEPLPLTFGKKDANTRHRRHDALLAACTIVGAIAGALMIKFSGLLLIAIPPLVLFAAPRTRGWFCRGSLAAVACTAALSLAFPYYYHRYYIPEGKFFPLNTEWEAKEGVERSIVKRDEDTLRFYIELFKPTKVYAEQGPTHSDADVNRLSDAWRDLWIRDSWTGDTHPAALKVGLVYSRGVPWLMAMGVIFFLRRVRRRTLWIRLGWVLLAYSLVQLTALIQYIYRIPYAGYGPSKGIYILPTVWGVSYLVVQSFQDPRLLPRMLRPHIHLLQHACLCAIAAFVVVNHAIPAY